MKIRAGKSNIQSFLSHKDDGNLVVFALQKVNGE
jgi:hypothetical protein